MHRINDYSIAVNTETWKDNTQATQWLLETITNNASSITQLIIKDFFYESHTYLYLSELENITPSKHWLLQLYIEEVKEGLIGFLKILAQIYPQLSIK